MSNFSAIVRPITTPADCSWLREEPAIKKPLHINSPETSGAFCKVMIWEECKLLYVLMGPCVQALQKQLLHERFPPARPAPVY